MGSRRPTARTHPTWITATRSLLKIVWWMLLIEESRASTCYDTAVTRQVIIFKMEALTLKAFSLSGSMPDDCSLTSSSSSSSLSSSSSFMGSLQLLTPVGATVTPSVAEPCSWLDLTGTPWMWTETAAEFNMCGFWDAKTDTRYMYLPRSESSTYHSANCKIPASRVALSVTCDRHIITGAETIDGL